MIDLNTPNQYGIPLHACNGYRCDEHYWAFIKHMRVTGQDFIAFMREARNHFSGSVE